VMIKTGVATTRAEESVIATALNSFESDKADVPTESEGLEALTHPAAFMTTVPTDPFTRRTANPRQYQYFRALSPQHRWIVVSVGPDGVADAEQVITARRAGQVVLSGATSGFPMGDTVLFTSVAEFDRFVATYSYDPTNGAASGGDLIKVYGR